MPRKRRFVENESPCDLKTEEKSNDLSQMLRRSRRKTTNSELKPEKLIESGNSSKLSKCSPKLDKVAKKPKVVIKKIKDEVHVPNSVHDSPNSTDSGIGSGHNSKEENTSEVFPAVELSIPVKIDICTDLKNSKSMVKIFNLKTESNQVGSYAMGKGMQYLKSKRKIEDLHHEQSISEVDSVIKKRCLLKKDLKSTELLLNKINSSELSPDSDFINNESTTKEKSILQVLTQHEFPSSSMEDSELKKFDDGNYDSGSDSDWEEVEDKKEQSLEDYNPEIPKDGVEITIDCPELNFHKRKKKQFDEMEYIRLHINRELREHQLNAYKTHLLCLLAHGFYVNDILNSSLLKAFALSIIPNNISSLTAGKKVDKIDLEGLEKIISWFQNEFSFENKQPTFLNFKDSFSKDFQNQKSLNCSEYNLMFIVIARTLGFKTRLCISFYPITHKAQNLLKKCNSKKNQDSKTPKLPKKAEDDSFKLNSINEENVSKKSKKVQQTKCKKKKLETQPKQKSRSKRSIEKSYKISSDESDEDFIKEHFKVSNKRKSPKSSLKRQSNRKVLSSDSSPERTIVKCDEVVCWAEVFCKSCKQWISIECTNNVIDKPYDIEKLLPQPVVYILAFDNESYVKDITRRYCNEYMTTTLKLRPDSEWWEETLEPFLPPNSKLNKEEENMLDEMLINKPLPKTVSGFKNHPLYALKRHLLKFEAIYPPDAAPVGFLRGEPIYARECVCQLHSRETWLKEARVVRVGEEPYKIVKARPKWDKIAGVLRTDLPLEIFGMWQTEPYQPPVAVGGKVPRNEYGNVELFKPSMLPKGTVHLQIPGLNRIAKKLGIDCSPAVVGFDGHKGSVHPVFDGFVVCKEFKDTLLAAWEEEQENARKREEEKRVKRIYGNWKKLIRGLLIREKIKLKYDVK